MDSMRRISIFRTLAIQLDPSIFWIWSYALPPSHHGWVRSQHYNAIKIKLENRIKQKTSNSLWVISDDNENTLYTQNPAIPCNEIIACSIKASLIQILWYFHRLIRKFKMCIKDPIKRRDNKLVSANSGKIVAKFFSIKW